MARPIPFLVAIMSGFSISSPFAQLFGVLPGGDGHQSRVKSLGARCVSNASLHPLPLHLHGVYNLYNQLNRIFTTLSPAFRHHPNEVLSARETLQGTRRLRLDRVQHAPTLCGCKAFRLFCRFEGSASIEGLFSKGEVQIRYLHWPIAACTIYVHMYVHNTISLRSFGGTTAESNPNDKIALGYALSAPSLILIELYDRRRQRYPIWHFQTFDFLGQKNFRGAPKSDKLDIFDNVRWPQLIEFTAQHS